jgi:hypothetical protein
MAFETENPCRVFFMALRCPLVSSPSRWGMLVVSDSASDCHMNESLELLQDVSQSYGNQPLATMLPFKRPRNSGSFLFTRLVL